MSTKELSVLEPETQQVVKALSSQTNLKIIKLISQEKLDISTIATRLNLSEPSISEGVKQLEKLQLIKTSYTTGKRGIRKVCELTIEKLVLTFKTA